jgi:acyl-CoA thioester hydrolase
MPGFRFYHPVEVRYGDLDPQGHVNNAKYLTYMEQARIAYLRHLELWEGGSFLKIGVILADVQATFLAPILFGQDVRVGVQVTRLGNKSMVMEYEIEDHHSGQIQATGKSVLVAYDYKAEKSMPIPDSWRRAIAAFEQFGPG